MRCAAVAGTHFLWRMEKIACLLCFPSTDLRRLTTGVRSEKSVFRRLRRCANVIECTYTNLESVAYYTPRLYGIV